MRHPLALASLAALAALALIPAAPSSRAEDGPRDVAALLRPIRERRKLPALAGAVVRADGTLEALGADGLRRRDAKTAVTWGDRFHLGSCTKSMTATLCAMLVEEKRLAWTTTIADVWPERARKADPAWRGVTLEELLTHRGGVPSDLSADGLWGRLWRQEGTPSQQRLQLLDGVLARPPVHAPGTAFLYSNAGFAIAGAMAEEVAGAPWEELMRRRLFEPLGMATAGFGAPGTREALGEPRGHTASGEPVEPGIAADNPPAIGPAGRVHCSLADWAKYIALHLRGERGGAAPLLSAESFAKLHEPWGPKAEPSYAMGWGVAARDWAGGRVLTHSGSNTMWFCVTWLAPGRDFAVLAACNQGGPEAERACDEASWALIQDHLAQAARREF